MKVKLFLISMALIAAFALGAVVSQVTTKHSIEAQENSAAKDGANSDSKSDAKDGEATPKPYTPRVLGEKWIDRATNAWSAGDYPEAIFWYRKWLEASPTDNHAWYNLACTYAISNQPEKAIDAFEAAVDAGWSDAESAAKDPDFTTIATTERFTNAIARINAANQAKEVEGRVRRVIPMMSTGTYVAYLPSGYDNLDTDAKSKLKICIILHGRGSTDIGHGDALSGILGRDGVIYIAPRANHIQTEASIRTQRAGYAVYPNEWPSEPTQNVHPFVQYSDHIYQSILDARKAFSIPSQTRVHVIGHSMGGSAAIAFAARYPEVVESCFIHAGFVPGRHQTDYPVPNALGPRDDGGGGLAAAKSLGVEFIVSHSKGDAIVPLIDAEEIVTTLAAAGIEAKTMFWDATTHGFPPEAREAAKTWLRGN